MQDIIKDKISFIGLGKLGLPLSTIFAKNGVKVVGIDKQQELIDKLKDGDVPFFEEGLQENLNLSRDTIEYKSDYDGVVKETDISVILVNTQLGKNYSTVNDISIMSRYLIANYPEYYTYFKETDFTWDRTGGDPISQGNRNPLLYKNIGVDGIKTGYLAVEKYSLAASLRSGSRRINSVGSGYNTKNSSSYDV